MASPLTDSSGAEPLVFKARRERAAAESPPGEALKAEERLAYRVELRALEGMQKEALVTQLNAPGCTWRLMSDEGPYLNGTDLAPFPLAFFTVGLQFCLMSGLLRLASAHGVELGSLTVSMDNWYTMTGSALRGDMVGGAKPPEALVKVESSSPGEAVARLIRLAEAGSPAAAVIRDPLANTFSLNLNGRPVPVTGLNQSDATGVADPLGRFEVVRAEDPADYLPGIITKVAAAERVYGEGGVASSLQPEQKRTLHVRGEARLLDDQVLESVVSLFSPVGSSFRFLGEAGEKERTPSALAYLSAGIGFCYMTQLGRYAHITKQRIDSVRLVQDTEFVIGPAVDWAARASAAPVETHVFVESDESEEAVRKLVRMGEQTCFLHASMRGSFPARIRAELNGEALPL